MGQKVTEADVGKRVETHEGDYIGVVASVDETTLYVEPNPDTVDSIKAPLGWEADASEVVPVNQAVVGELTSDAIVLDRELAVQGATVGTGAGTPPEYGGEPADDSGNPPDVDVDPDEVTDGEPSSTVRPEEDVGSRTDSTDSGPDVGLEPMAEPRRSDARSGEQRGRPPTEDDIDEQGEATAPADETTGEQTDLHEFEPDTDRADGSSSKRDDDLRDR